MNFHKIQAIARFKREGLVAPSGCTKTHINSSHTTTPTMTLNKIFKFLLPLLLASLVIARGPTLDDVAERDAGNDGEENESLPCAVSPDGTFKSSEGSLLDAQFTFRLEYGSQYEKLPLLKEMSEAVGNAIISLIFPSCTPLFDYDLDPDLASVISGMDTNLVYASGGSCMSSSENNSCEIFETGFKVYLNDSTGRKLYLGAAIVEDTILGIVKKLMDTGDVASMVDGIEGIKFGPVDAEPDEGGGEPDEEKGGEDEKAAEELEQEILNKDLDLTGSENEVVLQSTNGDPGEQNVPDKKAVSYVGWIMLAVSTVVVALVGYQYHRRKKETYKETPLSEWCENDFEVENVLVDLEKSGSDDEFVEVVFDSSR